MNWLNKWLRGKDLKASPPMRIAVRRFKAGESNRLTASWTTTSHSINADIFRNLEPLRSRSRDLWANNEYAKKFFSMVANNVVGPRGFTLQNRSRRLDGTLDTEDNQRIESQMKSWSKRGSCDVTGRLSRVAVERLFIDTVARDGECLIRKRDGFSNANRFALQFIDVDRLDIQHNESRNSQTGNKVTMGVELDRDDRPIAYHILERHPDPVLSQARPNRRVRIPADEIIHSFVTIRPEQVRGIPWMHAAMLSLNDVGGYREAAIIAARVGAAKMGFWKSEDGEGGPSDGVDSAGNLVTEAEAGTFEQIPEGVSLETWDPTYPHDQFESFNKAMLRGIAGGFGVAYHNLANDLESVNLSAARTHVIDERDLWMGIQQWMSDSLHDDYFPEWLRIQIPLMSLPMSRFEKFNAPTWHPRRWQWPEPLKDEQANSLAYGMRTKSLRRIIEDRGFDADELWLEMAEDQRKLAELGISATLPQTVQLEGELNAEES